MDYDPCPAQPCEACKGTVPNGQTSWDWCRTVNACAATIDWEKIYGDKY